MHFTKLIIYFYHFHAELLCSILNCTTNIKGFKTLIFLSLRVTDSFTQILFDKV